MLAKFYPGYKGMPVMEYCLCGGSSDSGTGIPVGKRVDRKRLRERSTCDALKIISWAEHAVIASPRARRKKSSTRRRTQEAGALAPSASSWCPRVGG